MALTRLYAEFESPELAELCAGRIRRNVRGIRRMTVRQLGKGVQERRGAQQFTMLPANLRMMNYATDVLWSEVSDTAVPEPLHRRTAELLVICDAQQKGRVSALLQAAGAVHLRESQNGKS